ncbi:MAG: nuclear transport factor 2 family protein [Rhodospirillales bacterium]|nr:nuclear transport factor 2 family protein [Rhodospirillales bacterium]
MSEPTLEQQVARLTAIEDIKQMKARYCGYADAGYDPEGLASLFVEDGIWDGGEFGRYVGAEAIKEFFGGISSDIIFAGHLVMNPIITVNGDSANGKWWLIMPSTTNIDGKKEARWLAAEYDDDYVKVGGCWLHRHLKLDLKFFVPYLDGWVEQT